MSLEMDIERNNFQNQTSETDTPIHHLAEKCYVFSIILIVIGLIFASAITYIMLDILISTPTPIDFEIRFNQSN